MKMPNINIHLIKVNPQSLQTFQLTGSLEFMCDIHENFYQYQKMLRKILKLI